MSPLKGASSYPHDTVYLDSKITDPWECVQIDLDNAVFDACWYAHAFIEWWKRVSLAWPEVVLVISLQSSFGQTQ